ncbi:hypothetical protein Y032_0074g817 [Ancylostoma ceylanicum]|uniref:DUF4781 domain-containing protein n=1 Tax=Ancylostoma ceylanicum TaxID=53326 RepID=A0A016TV78_9BILA|nr:hypothetical protein Y032_0074g817 [Ancylostoma ceylanicum]
MCAYHNDRNSVEQKPRRPWKQPLMGNTLAAEFPSTWSDPDVLKWKKDAEARQQCVYLQFEGSQFQDITDLSEELCITKICFAIYGMPTNEANTLEEAYTADQRKFAAKVYNTIRDIWLKAPMSRFKLGFIFVFCKQGDEEYQVPLFRLLWDESDEHTSRYIDTACRVYESAQDWRDNNCMPMMKYCYPKRLFYTCSSGYDYRFDPDEKTVLQFGTSPACDFLSRVGRTLDVVISTVGMTVGVAALFTPAGFISAPILLGVGGTSAVYGAGRAVNRLIDKVTHGESLTDLEGVLLTLSIIAAPLSFLTSLSNARLAAGAASGRIFSQTQRILATVLSLTTLTVDSFSFILNVVNLIDKFENDNLTTLDVLQFSVSTLFFANTLIQPKTAWDVIAKAQEQRITAIADNLSDAQAKAAFRSFLEENKGDGSIRATSKVVRCLNRVEDPNRFFKSIDGYSTKIAGRKGKTVFLSNDKGAVHQLRPNDRVRLSMGGQHEPKIQKIGKLRECLGCDYKKHELLGDLTAQQKGRVNKVFGGAAKYNRNIVDYAARLARKMGVSDPDGFMSLVEVVAAKANANSQFNYNDEATFNSFHSDIMSDLVKIGKIAAGKNRKFADQFKALYHYRKHGEEFMESCTPEFYVGNLPSNILRNGKLTDVCDITSINTDGIRETFTKKTYFLPNDSMLVTIEKEGVNQITISTMFKKPCGWEEFMNRFQMTNVPLPQMALDRLASVTGLAAVQLVLRSNSSTYQNFDFCKSDPGYEMYQMMVAVLVSDLADYFDQNNNER